MILANTYALLVPSTINGEIPAPEIQAEVTQLVLEKMVDLFGGATIYDAKGAYKMASGKVVLENIKVVEASTDSLDNDAMYSLARYVCDRMTQESVALKINNQLHLVESKEQLRLAA
jgi:hypothetical protein